MFPSSYKVHRLEDMCINVIANCFPTDLADMGSPIDMLGIQARDERLVNKLLRGLKARGKLNSWAIRSIASQYTSKLDFSHAFPILGSEDIEYMSQVCTDLETLILTNCPTLDTKMLVNLVKGCTKLKRLDISKCSSVSDASLVELAQVPDSEKLQELRVSSIPGVTDRTIQHVQKKLPHCKVIH